MVISNVAQLLFHLCIFWVRINSFLGVEKTSADFGYHSSICIIGYLEILRGLPPSMCWVATQKGWLSLWYWNMDYIWAVHSLLSVGLLNLNDLVLWLCRLRLLYILLDCTVQKVLVVVKVVKKKSLYLSGAMSFGWLLLFCGCAQVFCHFPALSSLGSILWKRPDEAVFASEHQG